MAGLAEARLPESTLDFRRLLPRKVPRAAVFSMKDHLVWCAGMVRTRDGFRHMLFSRWPRTLGFEAWDQDAPFLTEYGRCLYLIESEDGLKWSSSQHALVTPFRLTWDDGLTENFERLEMPKLHIENGRPRVLFLAARLAGRPAMPSFNVAIPLGGSL